MWLKKFIASVWVLGALFLMGNTPVSRRGLPATPKLVPLPAAPGPPPRQATQQRPGKIDSLELGVGPYPMRLFVEGLPDEVTLRRLERVPNLELWVRLVAGNMLTPAERRKLRRLPQFSLELSLPLEAIHARAISELSGLRSIRLRLRGSRLLTPALLNRLRRMGPATLSIEVAHFDGLQKGTLASLFEGAGNLKLLVPSSEWAVAARAVGAAHGRSLQPVIVSGAKGVDPFGFSTPVLKGVPGRIQLRVGEGVPQTKILRSLNLSGIPVTVRLQAGIQARALRALRELPGLILEFDSPHGLQDKGVFQALLQIQNQKPDGPSKKISR